MGNIHPHRIANISGKQPQPNKTISFSYANIRKEVKYPHHDALVVHIVIAKFNTRWMLVDDGSSVDIISFDAITQMGLKGGIKPFKSELYSFDGHPIFPRGHFSLLVTFGDNKHKRTIQVDFVVVDDSKWFNGIFGRPVIYTLQMVVSTYHLMGKFPTEDDIAIMYDTRMKPEIVTSDPQRIKPQKSNLVKLLSSKLEKLSNDVRNVLVEI